MNDENYGPPTHEDDMWYQTYVVEKDYPPVRRGKMTHPGQTDIYTFLSSQRRRMTFHSPGIWAIGTTDNIRYHTIEEAGVYEVCSDGTIKRVGD